MQVYILEQLDGNSLTNVEQVNSPWRQTIVDGRLWKKLLERLVIHSSAWRDIVDILLRQILSHTMMTSWKSNCGTNKCANRRCKRTGKLAPYLDSHRQVSLAADGYVEETAPYFQMDSLRIVHLISDQHDVGDVGDCFQICNRWTFDQENITSALELDQETHRYTEYNFSRNLLAAIVDGSHRSNKILVRNLNSEEKPIARMCLLHESFDPFATPLGDLGVEKNRHIDGK